MAVTKQICINHYKDLLETYYFLMFFPHNVRDDISVVNYPKVTGVTFPELLPLIEKGEKLQSSLLANIKAALPGVTYSTAISALSAFRKLVNKEETNVVSILQFTEALTNENDEEAEYIYSILFQILAAYNGEFAPKDLKVYIPLKSSSGGRLIGEIHNVVANSHSTPYNNWCNKILLPLLNTIEEGYKRKFLHQTATELSFAFMPTGENVDLCLPEFNVIVIDSLLKMTIDSDKESALKGHMLYQFLTWNSSNIQTLSPFLANFCRDIANFGRNAGFKTNSIIAYVGKDTVEEFKNRNLSNSLESFRLAELELIKKTYLPDDEVDTDLLPDAHDPNDDKNLDPGANTLVTYFGIEADDPFSGGDEADTEEDSGEESSETSDSGDDSSTDSSSDNSSDSSLGEDPTSDSGGGDSDPFGNDNNGDTTTTAPPDGGSDKEDDDKDKVVSSKNAITNKAYKAMWGKNPFILANDSDPEGYFYRENVCKLNRLLQDDPGEAIPKASKMLLNDWCKFWIHCSDVRFTVNLVKELGLSKYLRA